MAKLHFRHVASYIMVMTLSMLCLLTNINAQAPQAPQDLYEEGFSYCSKNMVPDNDPWATTVFEALKTLGHSLALRGPVNSSYSMHEFLGDGPSVHTMYQCRHDLTHDQCLSCVLALNKAGLCVVGYQGGAKNDACVIKFSSNDLRKENPSMFMMAKCDNQVPEDIQANPSTYTNDVQNLIDTLVLNAPDSYFFNTSQETIDGLTLYGAAQCDMYLSKVECDYCLSNIREAWKVQCGLTQGARVFAYSCYYRFATHKFIA